MTASSDGKILSLQPHCAWALALSLLVLRVLTDDPDLTLSLDDFALIADRFYRRSYFHLSSSF